MEEKKVSTKEIKKCLSKTKVIQSRTMLPSSGNTKMFSGNLRIASGNTGGGFCRLKIKFTIFCHSKAFLLQCGPHNAGRGSPWEWMGHALEMMETLKQIEQLISTTIENLCSKGFHESFWKCVCFPAEKTDTTLLSAPLIRRCARTHGLKRN